MSDLLKINVNAHTEKKGQLTYLSWAWAWAEVLKIDPRATWECKAPGTDGPAFFFADGTAMVGVSVRSLQRRLARVNESYHHLVDSVRFETGITLLRGENVRFVDIAAELGYADQASFTRAFRRWTGMAPRAFRRAQA